MLRINDGGHVNGQEVRVHVDAAIVIDQGIAWKSDGMTEDDGCQNKGVMGDLKLGYLRDLRYILHKISDILHHIKWVLVYDLRIS